MNIEIRLDKTNDTIRKLSITIPADSIQKRYDSELAKLQQKVKLKGFRPGHVPIEMVKTQFGESLKHDLYHDLIDEAYRQAVVKHELHVIGNPKVEISSGKGHSLILGQSISFHAECEVMPKIELKPYKNILVKDEKIEVKEDELLKLLHDLQESNAQLVPLEKPRAAAKSDYVDFEFKGKLFDTKDGVETATELPELKGHRVAELGMGELIPGFEDEMVGLNAGEEKTFILQFPPDFQDPRFKEKKAEFWVKLNEIKSKKLPDLNDDFAKGIGAEDFADLKKRVSDQIAKNHEQNLRKKWEIQIVDQLIKDNDFSIPSSMIDTQEKNIIEDWTNHLKQQGQDEDSIQKSITKEKSNFRKRAENQVRTAILLDHISSNENIEVTKTELDREMERLALSAGFPIQRLRDFYLKNPSKKQGLEFRLREEKTLSWLVDQSQKS